MRTIDERNITVNQVVSVDERGGEGRRVAYRDGVPFCMEADDATRVVPFMLAAGPLAGKTVAWIGGGFCIGPKAFAVADCKQTVYEIEPSMRQFCPDSILFVSGDWRDTISGKYDLIVYDIGGPMDRKTLEPHLNPGGVVLGLEA